MKTALIRLWTSAFFVSSMMWKFLSDIAETVQRAIQGLVTLCEVKTDQVVDRLLKETGAGNGAHANLSGQILAEGQIAVVSELGDSIDDISICGIIKLARTLQGDQKIVAATGS